MPDLKPPEIEQLLEREYQRFAVLKSRRMVLGTSLSGGEQQMLAVSRALMMKPRLIMLDEPSLGLAPQIVSAIFRALRELAAASRRFDDFVRELARFNEHFGRHIGDH